MSDGFFTGGATSSSEYKKTFFNHVFSTTEESRAEFLNIIQYSSLGILPVIILNKIVNRMIPDADSDKSSLEIILEIIVQLIVMFCGIILIHRMITYVPTYSGFKYEHLALTNVVLAFLVLVLSIQTKIGIKSNILVDRVVELWDGPSTKNAPARRSVRVGATSSILGHSPSQADQLDSSIIQTDVYPRAPSAAAANASSVTPFMDSGPAPANSMIGGSFF
jgi:hypothetical protein